MNPHNMDTWDISVYLLNVTHPSNSHNTNNKHKQKNDDDDDDDGSDHVSLCSDHVSICVMENWQTEQLWTRLYVYLGQNVCMVRMFGMNLQRKPLVLYVFAIVGVRAGTFYFFESTR